MTAQHDIGAADTAADSDVVHQPPQNLYVVRGWKNDDFYYHNEAHAKKQLLVLTMKGDGRKSRRNNVVFDDDDDDDASESTPSMFVYAKGKWANLTLVSTTTLDVAKLSKLPSEDATKIVELISVVLPSSGQ